MHKLVAYLYGYCLWMGGTATAQNIYFKDHIGIGSKTPLVIYSQTHLIDRTLPIYGSLIYRGKEAQQLQNQQLLTIGKLDVDNPNGLGIRNSIHIQNRLKFSRGHLFAISPHIDAAPLSEVVLSFASAAILESSQKNNYIDLPIKLENKSQFHFPFGNQIERNFLFFETDATDLSLEMSYQNLPNNKLGTTQYSSPNYLKRMGVLHLKSNGFWRLRTEQSRMIQIRVRKAEAMDQITEIKNPGLAVWNKTTKNWNLLPLVSQSEGLLQTDFFMANKYSHLVLCDCISPDLKYRPYGNFAISPNGDGLNELPVFKQYTRDRAAYFELYNRYGIRVLAAKWNDILNGKQHLNLPRIKTGTYFYVLRMKRPNQHEQGYIYVKK
ncbi:MAG: gliding motility-associated C-terminal domain-containing protein [Flavobacteriia bacterium]|nr:gliding motility-associated C-terminal domain-containing protein [Flavobacteriia bacterium]